jgi:16S rRNA (guanine527-N7)-methyltransferase
LEVSRETVVSTYFPSAEEKIERYAEILATWGIERGLIGPREADRIWDRHIANSLPVTSLIPEGSSVVDIGSGAGLPGLVIALARPDLTVTLVEPLARRVVFLEEAVAELGLQVEVIRGRAEAVKRTFDVVTARAVAPLPKLIQITWPLMAKKGRILAIKGESAEAELADTSLPKGAQGKLHLVELPGLPLGRIVEIRRSIEG